MQKQSEYALGTVCFGNFLSLWAPSSIKKIYFTNVYYKDEYNPGCIHYYVFIIIIFFFILILKEVYMKAFLWAFRYYAVVHNG